MHWVAKNGTLTDIQVSLQRKTGNTYTHRVQISKASKSFYFAFRNSTCYCCSRPEKKNIFIFEILLLSYTIHFDFPFRFCCFSYEPFFSCHSISKVSYTHALAPHPSEFHILTRWNLLHVTRFPQLSHFSAMLSHGDESSQRNKSQQINQSITYIRNFNSRFI